MLVIGVILLALFALLLVAMLLNTILTTRHVRLKEKHGPEVIDEHLAELDRPGNLWWSRGE